MKEDSEEIIDQTHEPVPPGYEVLKRVEPAAERQPTPERLIVKKKAENDLAGDIVKSAQMGRGNLGEPEIDSHSTTRRQNGSPKSRATTSATGWPSFWTVNLFRPAHQRAIETGNVSITGHFTTRRRRNWPMCCKIPCARR